MKERPILMIAPMVRSTLAGSKWQTRRILKCPHKKEDGKMVLEEPYRFPNGCGPVSGMYRGRAWELWGPIGEDGRGLLHEWGFECPYGVVGDRLWVRETWTDYRERTPEEADGANKAWENYRDGKTGLVEAAESIPHGTGEQKAIYRADFDSDVDWKWKPSIFMPRWACRINLEIIEIRVERLQVISADDALAEGIVSTEFWTPKELDKRPFEEKWWDDYHFWNNYPQMVYRRLWESIHGADSWEHDPLVWCISFKVL